MSLYCVKYLYNNNILIKIKIKQSKNESYQHLLSRLSICKFSILTCINN